MKTIITLIFCVASLHAADDIGDISFKYGFLGKLQSNPDSTVELSDSSIIHSEDIIRINVGYFNKTYFYLIYLDSNRAYDLYPEPLNPDTEQDTVYLRALYGGLVDPIGLETFYFINSKTQLTELEKLMARYGRAPDKARVKLANRIQGMIDDLDPSVKGDLALIPNRLDKPMVGGVAFRGHDDDNLKDMSLTHTCTGSNGVAFQKIVLNHQ